MDGDKKELNLPPNPQTKANILSRLTVSWTAEIFKKGTKKDLEVTDLYAPLDEHKSDHLGNTLHKCWQRELRRAKQSGRQPRFVWAVVRCYGLNVLILGIAMLVSQILLRIIQPILLNRLLLYFSPGSTMPKSDAWGYAVGVVLCTASNLMMLTPLWLGLLHLAMKMRVACCSVMYRKVLRLSKSALGHTAVGQVVNLMTNDVNRFEHSIIFLHYLWMGPVTLLVVTYFLLLEVGVSALVGVASLLISIPAQMWLAKKKSVYRIKTAKLTDSRINLMHELVGGMSVIKMFTWEKPFEKLVSEARRLEIKEIRGGSYVTGIMMSFLVFNNRLAIYCCIVTYVLLGNLINAATVFVVASYFTLIRQMMSDWFSLAIGLTAELVVSLGRMEEFSVIEFQYQRRMISCHYLLKTANTQDQMNCFVQKFLLNDEMEVVATSEEKGKVNLAFDSDYKGGDVKRDNLKANENASDRTSNGVVLKDVSAKWSEDTFEETLSNININFLPGKLFVVIGAVGSGKSSLLHAILRELPLSNGSLQVNGSVSYAAQEPWLFEGTVRQNILFGNPYQESRYRLVVRACALRTDFEQLAHGDQTPVGDRGVALSGGQRARINMARAVYRESDIYLLDDPLSAVDTHVGKHLFDQCISGFLKGKTVILITHQLQYLSSADHIVLLQDGKVSVQGTYQELKSSGTDFSKLMFDNKEEDDDETKRTSLKRTFSHTEPAKPLVVEDVEGEEEVTKDSVPAHVFRAYLTAGGHWISMVFLLFLFGFTQFVSSAGDYWLTYWVNLEEYVFYRDPNVTSTASIDFPFYLSQSWCIIVFTIITVCTIVLAIARSLFFFYICTRSSMWLHNTMFSSVTRAVMRFFHTNSSGRILNRFTKDMGTVDEILPITLLDVLQFGLMVVGIVAVLAVVNPWLLIPTFVVALIFYFLQNFYLNTSRGLKRLEATTRSPVFTHLNASLQGLTTIRAFKKEAVLETEFDRHQDLHSSAFYLFTTTARAFGLWLDGICFIFITVVTFSFLLIGDSWLGGSVGLAITQTVGLVGLFQWCMKQGADTENFMTSVERILLYTNVEKEPPLESTPGNKPPSDWPSEGKLEFSQVSMAYDSSLPTVLKDLSFTIQPREKVGVVGRTGAGKSSLTSALFRLAPIQGKIIIDNVDVTNIGLHDLRSKLSIIPQEPVLFSGTVRKNLDPFEEFSDHILWSALEEVELKDVIDDLSDGLNSKITEGGSNLSVGQRQLMCLARAIVRNNRILVMDEATANVDPQTDALIQMTIRRKFADCTVLTIAHRLNTVMDSDKILVMNHGSLVEFDHPHVLLGNKQGYLYRMVEQLGRSAAESLHNIATMNYNKHTGVVHGRPKEL